MAQINILANINKALNRNENQEKREGIFTMAKRMCPGLFVILAFVCHHSTECETIAKQELDASELKDLLMSGYQEAMSILNDCRITMESQAWRDPNWLKSVNISKDVSLTRINTEYVRKDKKVGRISFLLYDI